MDLSNFEVKLSQIVAAGFGLYTTVAIDAYDQIGTYTGPEEEILDYQFVHTKYDAPRKDYAMMVYKAGKWKEVDGRKCIFGKMNDDIKNEFGGSNVESNLKGELFASVDIAPGEELFLSYGADYWHRKRGITDEERRRLARTGGVPKTPRRFTLLF